MLLITERLIDPSDKIIDADIRRLVIANISDQINDLKKEKTRLKKLGNATGRVSLTSLEAELKNSLDNIELYKDSGEEDMVQHYKDEAKEIQKKIDDYEQGEEEYSKEKFTQINTSIKDLEEKIKRIKSGKEDYDIEEISLWDKEYVNRRLAGHNYVNFTNFINRIKSQKYSEQLMKFKNLLVKYLDDLSIPIVYDDITIDNFYNLADKIDYRIQMLYNMGLNPKSDVSKIWDKDLENHIRNTVNFSNEEKENFLNFINTVLTYKPITRKKEKGIDGKKLGKALEKGLINFIDRVSAGNSKGSVGSDKDPVISMLLSDPKGSTEGKETLDDYFEAIYLIIKRYAHEFGGSPYNINNKKDKITDESYNPSNEPIDFIFNGIAFSLKRKIDGSSAAQLMDHSDSTGELDKFLAIMSLLQEPGLKFDDTVWLTYNNIGQIIAVNSNEPRNIPNKIEKYSLNKNLKKFIDLSFRVPHHLMMVSKEYVIFVDYTDIARNINLKSFVYPKGNKTSTGNQTYFEFQLRKPANMLVYRISDQIKMTRVSHKPQAADKWKWSSDMDKVRSSNVINKISSSDLRKKRYAIKNIVVSIRRSNDNPKIFKFKINMNLSMINLRLLEKSKFVEPFGEFYTELTEGLFGPDRDPKLNNIYQEYREQGKNYTRLGREVKNKIATRMFTLLSKTARSIGAIYRVMSTSTKNPDKMKELGSKLVKIKTEFKAKGSDLDREGIASVKRYSNQLESNDNPDRAEKISDTIEDLQKAIVSFRKFKI